MTARHALAAAALLAAPGLAQAAPDAALIRVRLAPDRALGAELVADTDGDGRADLVLIGRDGTLERFVGTADATLAAAGQLRLRDPGHSLVACRDVASAPGAELVVADPGGTCWLTWPVGDRAAAVQPLVRAARFTLRTDEPQVSPFVQDLDQDGRFDLLIPTRSGCAPFRCEGEDDGRPVFRALPALRLPVQVSANPSDGGLDDLHEGAVVVPRVETVDLDGDGRPDLITRDGKRHAFHLQLAAGGFAAPIEVDLAQFVDSTPAAAGLAPGATAVLGDQQLLQRGDIDGDGIPDFVIAHRRKVWTFLGSRTGPQFTKAHTQAVADDVSGMLLVDLDDDARADLLTFQVQIPTVGALLLGLVQSIDIDVKAVGYRSVDGAFANAPTWRRTVTLRVPPLLSLLARQQELVQRFVTLLDKARPGMHGAFTDAGHRDLALASADGTSLELYVGVPDNRLTSANGRRMLRDLLFDNPDPVFDLDRLFGLLAGLLDQRAAALTATAVARAAVPLRDRASWELLTLVAADFDGHPGEELLVVYGAVAAPGQRAYDLIAWPHAGAEEPVPTAAPDRLPR